jgi:ElaB/YqjD/DUF883 family membrane-anchored ribosome-binding protein
MATVLETYLGKEGKQMNDRVEKIVNTAKAAVEETIEDGKIAAERLMKRGRDVMANAAEDRLNEAARHVKRNPGRSLAIAFAAGTLIGMLLPRLTKRMAG